MRRSYARSLYHIGVCTKVSVRALDVFAHTGGPPELPHRCNIDRFTNRTINHNEMIDHMYKGNTYSIGVCPFCKGNDVHVSKRIPENDLQAVYVDCHTCDARGPLVKTDRYSGTPDDIEREATNEAVERWNGAPR